MYKFKKMSTYTEKYADHLKKNLRGVDHLTARKFLFRFGYSYSSFGMPEYYEPSNFDKIKLKRINWKNKPPPITKTLDIFTPKDYLSWRSFNFLNPYIYIHIVKEITESPNWILVKKLLSRKTLVNSFSVPNFYLKKSETARSKSISNWLQMAEKNLIKDCPNYNYLIVTDIKSFYASIYTHSIAWAIHGKSFIKSGKNRWNFGLLGNKLDKFFQNSRDGQTNGIPTGSMVSDIIAELILTDIDQKLSDFIKNRNLTKSVLVLRFRDDYRILSKNEDQCKLILQGLNKILNTEYGLNLNFDKTKNYDDIIEGAFRPWSLEIKKSAVLRKIYYRDLSDCTSTSFLKDCLIEIYNLQSKFKDGRASISVLSKLAEGLDKIINEIKLNLDDMPQIVAILRKITLLREEATPQAFLLLDILLKKIKSAKEKREILEEIGRVIRGKNDKDFQLMWFYRLCLSNRPSMCVTILSENSDIPLTNIMDRRKYRHDFNVFSKADLFASDIIELKKFSLINRNKLNISKNKKIDPETINTFKTLSI